MIAFELFRQFISAMARSHGERSNVVGSPGTLRRNKIRKGMVKLTQWFIHLLTQHVKFRQYLRARFIGVELDIVADAIRGPESVNAFRNKEPSIDDVLKKF